MRLYFIYGPLTFKPAYVNLLEGDQHKFLQYLALKILSPHYIMSLITYILLIVHDDLIVTKRKNGLVFLYKILANTYANHINFIRRTISPFMLGLIAIL